MRESRERRARLAELLRDVARERDGRLDAWRACADDRDRAREAFLARPYDPVAWPSLSERERAWVGGATNAEIDEVVERYLDAAETAERDAGRAVMVGARHLAPLNSADWEPSAEGMKPERWRALVAVARSEGAEILNGPQPRTIAEIAAQARRQADAVYEAHGLPAGHTVYLVRDKDQLDRPTEWSPASERFLGEPPIPPDGFRFAVSPSEIARRSGAHLGDPIGLAGAVHNAAEELGRASRARDATEKPAALALAGMALQRAMTDLEMATRPSRRVGGMTKAEALVARERQVATNIENAEAAGEAVANAKPLEIALEFLRAQRPESARMSLNACVTAVAAELGRNGDFSDIRNKIRRLFMRDPAGGRALVPDPAKVWES